MFIIIISDGGLVSQSRSHTDVTDLTRFHEHLQVWYRTRCCIRMWYWRKKRNGKCLV